MANTTLRVAYIPEHFSTPLFQADKQGYFAQHSLKIEFIPVIEGTGRLIKLLDAGEVDVAIGLTEGFVADLAKGNTNYNVIGTYVKSPLCWAISTGANRDELTQASDLHHKRIGVSRIGSGSYIMSFVLALKSGFDSTTPFFESHPTLSNFANLRDSVNLKNDDELKHSDAFMWEHFTSKKYYDNGEIKKIGEIYTPWPSWVISVRRELLVSNEQKELIGGFLQAINQGIKYFNANHEDAVQHIATNLDYSEADAKEWLKTVEFNDDVSRIDRKTVVDNTSEVLKTAGVLTDDDKLIDERLKSGVIELTD